MLALVSGQFIPPIHRKSLYSLQYSMLPAKRVSVRELWVLLSGETSMSEGNGSMNGSVNGNGWSSPANVNNNKKSIKKDKKYWWS